MSARRRWRWFGPATLPSSAALTIVLIAGWLGRGSLHEFWRSHPGSLPAVLWGAMMWVAAIFSVQRLRRWTTRVAWLERTVQRTGLQAVRRPTLLARWAARLPDPLEFLFRPILRTRLGRGLSADWSEAGLGEKGSRYLLLLLGGGLVAGFLGDRISGVILGAGMAAAAPLLPYRWVKGRVETLERRFSEQVPGALDAIASGLAAGLSFQGAVAYTVEEVSAPIAAALGRLERRLRLGMPVEAAVDQLLEEHDDESLKLAAEGIVLQRRLGGDLVRMLEESADLARNRVELEREVHAVTTQGRLSGWVIAGLVPASAGLLLATNPRYIDVLFETIIGQIMLVIALLLQLVGWAVISRLIRVEY